MASVEECKAGACGKASGTAATSASKVVAALGVLITIDGHLEPATVAAIAGQGSGPFLGGQRNARQPVALRLVKFTVGVFVGTFCIVGHVTACITVTSHLPLNHVVSYM